MTWVILKVFMSIRIIWRRACYNMTAGLTPHQSFWFNRMDVVQEKAFLTGSQVELELLIQGPPPRTSSSCLLGASLNSLDRHIGCTAKNITWNLVTFKIFVIYTNFDLQLKIYSNNCSTLGFLTMDKHLKNSNSLLVTSSTRFLFLTIKSIQRKYTIVNNSYFR